MNLSLLVEDAEIETLPGMVPVASLSRVGGALWFYAALSFMRCVWRGSAVGPGHPFNWCGIWFFKKHIEGLHFVVWGRNRSS